MKIQKYDKKENKNHLLGKGEVVLDLDGYYTDLIIMLSSKKHFRFGSLKGEFRLFFEEMEHSWPIEDFGHPDYSVYGFCKQEEKQ